MHCIVSYAYVSTKSSASVFKGNIFEIQITMDEDEGTKSKLDTMQRYGKQKWSEMNIEEIDKEFRVHLENMLDTSDIPTYWESHKHRIDYLLSIRPKHVQNLKTC